MDGPDLTLVLDCQIWGVVVGSFDHDDGPRTSRLERLSDAFYTTKSFPWQAAAPIGDTDMLVLEVFRSSYFADISLSDWLAHTPPALVAQHLNVDVATIAKFPNDKPEIMPQ
jgi:hypothetical protein